MSDRSKTMSFGECWLNRSQLEQILIGLLSVTIIIAIIFMIPFINSTMTTTSTAAPWIPPKICDSITCLKESAKIVHQIDPSADPCEDFYQFACGNFFTNHEHHGPNLQQKLEAQRKREFLNIYGAKIQSTEHKMVKAAKHLFRECMNEGEIERDGLRSIKEAIRKAGGWPALDGYQWNETSFDWLGASYMFRQLGYPHSIFLDLSIQPDDEVRDWYIFKVTAANPTTDSIGYDVDSKYVEKMTEVAMKFGATGLREEVLKEMEATYQFWQDLGRLYPIAPYFKRNELYLVAQSFYSVEIFSLTLIQVYDFYRQSFNLTNFQYYLPVEDSRMSVDTFQHKYGKNFNWLDFINNIAGLTARIDKHDYVLFQRQEQLREWLELISSTPKRTQANYMMWKVVERQLPYLTKNLQDFKNPKEKPEARADFCLREVEERFIISPIKVVYDRKYLPWDKKQKVEEIMLNIKAEFADMLRNVDWMEEKDKKATVEKAENISVVIGHPSNYFDDEILDNLDVDMIEPTTSTFLSFLAQATRNRQSSIYNQITKFVSENEFEDWYITNNSSLPIYKTEDNAIFVPTIATNGFPFHEKKPSYLNYAFLGQPFYGFLGPFESDHYHIHHGRIQGWSNWTKSALRTKMRCIENQFKDYETPFVVEQMVTGKIARGAYQKWAKRNGEEQKLIGIDYTPLQLFWIYATECLPTNFEPGSGYLYEFVKESASWANIVLRARRNSPDFAKDFGCLRESEMNPLVKCTIP